MIKRHLPIALVAPITLAIGCSRAVNWHASEWTSNMNSAPPTAPALKPESSASRLGTQKVQFEHQMVAGVPVAGSFRKTLSENGQAVWIKSRTLDGKGLPRARPVERQLARRDYVARRMRTLANKFGCKGGSAIEPQLIWHSGWQLVFNQVCETSGGEAYELVLSSGGRLLSDNPAGARLAPQMTDETATLYPLGPKLSQLKPLSVNVAIVPGFLFNSDVEVSSDADLKFASLAQIAASTPAEDRFDMLQAYFYATGALAWVKQHLKYEPSGLKIRTFVGYPQRASVAFYFDNEIRLGAGDDVSYSRMALDPTIVVHETMHGIIVPLTELPFQGEGGSLNEGLADSLTALQLDDPNMGDTAYKLGPYERTLANDAKFADQNGGLYHDSLILSGLVWDIRETVDEPTAEDFVRFLLAHLTPASDFNDAQAQLSAWLTQLPDADKASAAHLVAVKRGWL